MIINANTKIAPILKQNPKALDAIISIDRKFEKLRNPLLRRVMAGRTTLVAASKVAGCSLDDFFQKLEPLGFEINRDTEAMEERRRDFPSFISSLNKEQFAELDVRPVIDSGRDPLHIIMQKIKMIQPGQVLKIINTFEPTPLILMLEKKGFQTYVNVVDDHLIETYFHKPANGSIEQLKTEPTNSNNWDNILQRFKGNLNTIDVRQLEMPQPMLAILSALDELPEGTALYVYHKRIPVFLLPELAQRGFDYRIKEIKDAEVHLLIFKTDGSNNK